MHREGSGLDPSMSLEKRLFGCDQIGPDGSALFPLLSALNPFDPLLCSHCLDSGAVRGGGRSVHEVPNRNGWIVAFEQLGHPRMASEEQDLMPACELADCSSSQRRAGRIEVH